MSTQTDSSEPSGSRAVTIGAERNEELVKGYRYVFDDDPEDQKWQSGDDYAVIRIRRCHKCGGECEGRLLIPDRDTGEAPIVCPTCYTTS